MILRIKLVCLTPANYFQPDQKIAGEAQNLLKRVESVLRTGLCLKHKYETRAETNDESQAN
jgi:hypothetical protein